MEGEACRCGPGDTSAMCTRPPASRPAFSQPTWYGEPWSIANSPGGPLPQPETPPNTVSCAQQAPVLSSSRTTPCRLLTVLGARSLCRRRPAGLLSSTAHTKVGDWDGVGAARQLPTSRNETVSTDKNVLFDLTLLYIHLKFLRGTSSI